MEAEKKLPVLFPRLSRPFFPQGLAHKGLAAFDASPLGPAAPGLCALYHAAPLLPAREEGAETQAAGHTLCR